MGCFEQAVGKRTFTMVYMCDDTKVPDVFHGCKGKKRFTDLRIYGFGWRHVQFCILKGEW
jgi:hypothetical protein